MNKNKINFCHDFLKKVCDKQEFELKVRYLLEDFFFKEGWASKTNPNTAKEGHTFQYTYNDNTIKHFIEDMVRWSQFEFESKTKNRQYYKIENLNVDESLLKKQIKLVLESNIPDPDKNGIHNLLGDILDAIDDRKKYKKLVQEINKSVENVGRKPASGRILR